jgi:hypothetical protein
LDAKGDRKEAALASRSGTCAGKPGQVARRGLSPDRLFLLIAPVIFAAYALLTPPFQTFDESQHLERAWQVSALELRSERRGTQSGGELPPGLAVAMLKEIGSLVPQGERHVVVRPFSQIFEQNTPIGLDQPWLYYDFFGAVVYAPISYLPQSVAIRVGETLDLSVEWTLRLGRLLNCAVSIALIWWALRILPFGRWIALTVALLPPTAAGAASFGQDGLVIGTGFLLISSGLNVAQEKRWSIKSVLVVSVASIIIAVSKVVYLPLTAVGAIPRPPRVTWLRWISIPLLIALASTLLFVGWLRLDAAALVTARPPLPTTSEQLLWMISHPIDFSTLMARTYGALLPYFWANQYRFGDSTVPIIGTAVITGTAAILASMTYVEDRGVGPTKVQRAWMLLIFFGIAVLTATALFLGNTPRGADHIHGIQGRYFVPALPLVGIALSRSGKPGSAPLLTASLASAVAANLLTLSTIVRIFYSF